jgi:hypothetical protein
LEPLRGSSNKKTLYSTHSCVNWAFFGTRGPLKRSFHSRLKMAHSCQKRPNLHTNSSNKLLYYSITADQIIQRILSYYENPWKLNKVMSLPDEAINKGLMIGQRKSLTVGIDTIGPSTFFLSILVLIFTPEYAIKISCGSSGTPGICVPLDFP